MTPTTLAPPISGEYVHFMSESGRESSVKITEAFRGTLEPDVYIDAALCRGSSHVTPANERTTSVDEVVYLFQVRGDHMPDYVGCMMVYYNVILLYHV